MKNSCYNIGTKRKEQTKNVPNSQKKRRNANAQIRQSRKGSAKGRRDTTKKSEQRRVRKAMIPYHEGAKA